mgnify:FL=1
MNRQKFERYVLDNYDIKPDYPWAKNPDFAVFRHGGNKKWFALIMDIPKARLGIVEDGNIDVVNLKCDPVLIGSLKGKSGIYPAYHMNKANWITVALDESVDDDELRMLIDMSFELTAPKIHLKR